MTRFAQILLPEDGVVSGARGILVTGNDGGTTSGEATVAESHKEVLDPDPLTYRFGRVQVEIYPEIVVIVVPYEAPHEAFCEASLFVHRYTHAAAAGFVTDDDEQRVQLRIYPNTENLITGRPPYPLPAPDPRKSPAPAWRGGSLLGMIANLGAGLVSTPFYLW